MNHELPEGIPEGLTAKKEFAENHVDMAQVIGKRDILFVCLDTLRWDVAYAEQEHGGTPVLNRYGKWIKSFAPGNFTYPSHHAMFAGFLPAPVSARGIADREMLFFPKNIGMGRLSPPGAFMFEGPNFIEGLAKEGYQTNCIGGVAFFDKRSAIGSVFPAMFQHSYWRPTFGCACPESAENQIAFVVKRLEQTPAEQRVFYYINICAIHYPNWFYLQGAKKGQDNLQSHAAALRHVDAQLEVLFAAFKARGDAFVIVTSDHGSCYGEEGFQFHGLPNEITDTIPYKHFFL